jgi:CAAX protease family protein
MRKIAIVYLILIVFAETWIVFVGLVPGFMVYAALILALLSHYAVSDQTARHRLLAVLALVPLLRVLSLVLPFPQLPVVYWNGLVGVVLLMVIGFVIRLLHLSREELGLTLHRPRYQLLVGSAGIPLGFLGYLFSKSWANSGSYHSITFALLAIFAGIIEEFIFRGLLQNASWGVFGEASTVYTSTLYATVYMGTHSAGYVAVVGFSGLLASWSTQRTHSLLGAILLRTFFLGGLLLVWPSGKLF